MAIQMDLEKATFIDDDGRERSLFNGQLVGKGSQRFRTSWPFKDMKVGDVVVLEGDYNLDLTYKRGKKMPWAAAKSVERSKGWKFSGKRTEKGIVVKRIS